MASRKLPAFQFYPGDWMKDPALRSVSIEARGLWMDMICLMFESTERGYLKHSNGNPITVEQLARICGETSEKISELLQELRAAGVFSEADDVIYSRRLLRDEKERVAARKRKQRQRDNNTSHSDVTAMSPRASSSTSISSSVTPSSSNGEHAARVHSARAREAPSLEEIKQESVEKLYHPAGEVAEKYFNLRSRDGWMRSGINGNMIPVANWQADLAYCYSKGYLTEDEKNHSKHDFNQPL